MGFDAGTCEPVRIVEPQRHVERQLGHQSVGTLGPAETGARPVAILIEASGVSNAGELVRILNDEAMHGHASIEMIVSTFDCDHWQTCVRPSVT